jgi:2-oxoglutarate/2-oxoacid ferredoxin oxidoreductase subunit alpha
MKNKLYSIKVAGPAGLGVMEAGRVLGRALTSLGFSVLVYPEYPSRIKGGDNVTIVSFTTGGQPLPEKKNDFVIVLSDFSLKLHGQELKNTGVLIVDKNLKTSLGGILRVPLLEIAMKEVGREIAQNMVGLGAVFGLSNFPFSFLEKEISTSLANKGEKVITGNLAAAKTGYQLGKENKMARVVSFPGKSNKKDNLFLSGNEAFSWGAIEAGCSFASIYPMTPVNSILTDLAKKSKKVGLTVFYPEDEIAGINSAIGASFAGARSLVATSGGGFSLMTEGFTMAAAAEVPLVVIEGMRAGPSTGMATWSSQEDLLFLIRAGNGEFLRIIFTPGDPKEAFQAIFEAFNLADIYQLPVIVVSDKHLSESSFSLLKFSKKSLKLVIKRGKLLTADSPENYQRYQLTSDGISPRALPGQTVFLTNSYMHDEAGFSTEDGRVREKMKAKLLRKLKSFDEPGFTAYGPKDAPSTIICWGSTKMAVWQAVDNLSGQVNALHFYRPWPFSLLAKKAIKKAKSLVAVENNSTAQLAQLICQETGRKVEKKILKDNGQPFFAGEIEKKVG